MYLESQLASGLEVLVHRNVVPILDYAVEGKTDTTSQFQFKHKFEALVRTHSKKNEFFALKPSSLGFRETEVVDLVRTSVVTHRCKILVDAEDDVSLAQVWDISNKLMVEHNKDECNVFKTYQMYRKDALGVLEDDIHKTRQDGIWHGVKLVRGAYMTQDRCKGVLHDTKEDTDHAYDLAATMVLNQIAQEGSKTSLILATHNERSVDTVLDQSSAFRDDDKRRIRFATLMGMGDGITTKCLTHNRPVMKYVPFGPLSEMLPYLLRRLDENRMILKHI